MIMHTLKKNEDIDKLIAENKAVILQFGTSTCTPCVAIKAKLDKWGTEHSSIIMRYISVEEYPEVAAQRDVLSAPTVRLYVEGKLLLEKSGYFSLEEFLNQTERYLSILDNK